MIPLILGIGLIIYLLTVVILVVTYAYRDIDPSPIAVLVLLLPLVNTIAVVISFNGAKGEFKSKFTKFIRELRGHKN